ncbi:putative exported protein [Candidatus Burkholderia pumila]|uniref:Exported protein n=1 Tax=Candidatus Burkholderia pumila TaxID=1090375 RepID=A0ABR5HM45_9BURK|nr:putative exported protein [Candidatus Burkholderia pumila]
MTRSPLKSSWPHLMASAAFTLVSAVSLPSAWSQTEDAASASANPGAIQSQKLSTTDQQFVQDAGTAGATEIAAGKLALTHSSDKQVRDFAQRMISDHTKLARNLDVIAKRHGRISPPSADSSVIGSLQNLQGADFDKAYIGKVAVDGHQKAVELFKKESESGNDAALKAAASKALPVTSHHYAMAQQLAKTKASSRARCTLTR